MKNFKKVLTFCLACMLAISVTCATVCANEAGNAVSAFGFPDVADTTLDQITKYLHQYHVITGYPDGTFKPDHSVTRAEMAQLVTNMCCLQDAVPSTLYDGYYFPDVDSTHWAYNPIYICQNLNYMEGRDTGLFAPDDPVTYEEAIKMLVAALGYTPVAENSGGYPTGYLIASSSLGLSKGIDFIGEDFATRGDIARLIRNALDIPLMKQTGFGAEAEYTVMNGENGTSYESYNLMLTGK